MNLFKEILEWSQELPNWQRDALRRLLQRKKNLSKDESALSKNDYDELYVLLKAEHELPKPDGLSPKPLDSSHIPVTIQPGQSTILKELGELTHVNCIAPNQRLEFSEKGMSIIYGENGSGKSGYVRVIKQACRYRGEEAKVYPNVYDAASEDKIPTAKFKIEKDNDIPWENGCVPDERLSSISVFDSQCARSYIAKEQEVAYLPYGLDIIENLANDVIPELERRLKAEINTIGTDNVFSHLQGETEVGTLISQLSFKTNTKTVEKLGTLSQVDEKRIADLSKTLAETDPIIKADGIKHFVLRLKLAAKNIKRVESWINGDAVNNLKNADDEMVEAERVEQNAACVLQSNEKLLPGTGEPLWKALFEAARKYSTEVAYLNKGFPYTGDDAVCPLCQTPLDEARERLKRFEKYIKDDVAKTANKKRGDLADIRKNIIKANLSIALEQVLSEEIDKIDIVHAIKEYQTKIHEKQKWMLGALDNHSWSNPPDLVGSPYFALRKLAAQKLREARTYIKAADKEHKKKLEQEHRELIARQSLQKSQQGVLDLIERMKKVEALKKCQKDLKTKPISDKSRELASEVVTKKLQSALDKEFCELGIRHIETNLKKRTVRGKMFHQILLENLTNKNIYDILSEGEQRALALGAFLAELSLANHSCGIVFDDPVSSLDHSRRQKVASRLAHEAKKRQVIVFTHDTSFLRQIRREIEKHKIEHKICYLEWQGDKYAGSICEGLPWELKNYKERINNLKNIHKRLENMPWPQYPGEGDRTKMRNAYDDMRATIERVVQDLVLNEVIVRYDGYIKVGQLNGVVGFNKEEFNEINKLYKCCSEVVKSHDPSPEQNESVPDATKLGEDINALNVVIEMIKNRKSANKKSTESNSHNKQASTKQ